MYDDSLLIEDDGKDDEDNIPEEYNTVAKDRELANKLKKKAEKIIEVAVAYKRS